MRFAIPRVWLVVCLAALSAPAVAAAQGQGSDPPSMSPLRSIGISSRVFVPQLRAVTASSMDVQPPAAPRPKPRRPQPLVPMYGLLIGLNAIDVHSTYAALDTAGTRESNPVLAPVVDHKGAFIAVKAGSTVAFIWAAEKLWKTHPRAALIAAAAANGFAAYVVAHNYQVARK